MCRAKHVQLIWYNWNLVHRIIVKKNMRNQTFPSNSSYRPLESFPQIIVAMLGGLIIFTCLLLAVAIGYNVAYSGQIFPGVSVAGVNLSGLTPEEGAALLATRLNYPQRGRILFTDGEKYWEATPAQLGFFLDPQTTAMAAFHQGRNGSLVWRAFPNSTPGTQVSRFHSVYL
jgi:hypothetical protein